MKRCSRLCTCAAAVLLTAAPALVAQEPRAAATDARPSGGFQARVLALGSIGTDLEPPHYAGGGLVQLGYGRVSVLGLGMIGRGGEYESVLAGGALAVRVLAIGPLELTGFAGYGLYREDGASGIERDAAGILAGAFAAVRLGAATVALAFSDLTGEYAEDDVAEPFRFHVPRLSIGIGF